MSWRSETQRRTVGNRPCFGASIARDRGASSGGRRGGVVRWPRFVCAETGIGRGSCELRE